MKTITIKDRPALVLIDLQKSFDDVDSWLNPRNNPEAENNAGKLLHVWRSMGLPLIHILHRSPGSDIEEGIQRNEVNDETRPLNGESVIELNASCAFVGAELRKKLEDDGIKKVVVVGMSTDQDISSAIHMVSTYGYEAFVVYDATATVGKANPRISEQMYSAELIHDTAIASLKDTFASVVMTEEVISALRQH
jgi:nicotinamidase-related amidase